MTAQQDVVPGRATLVVAWCAAAVLGAAVIASVRSSQTPGDDVDPAWQRPGILDLGELPVPAPELTGVDLHVGSPTAVFFARQERADLLCAELSGWKRPAGLAVVVVAADAGSCPDGVATVNMEPLAAAEAFGLRRPRRGVAPAGYAIVDGAGRIRYRTLDPVAAQLLDEVSTMTRGLR